MPCWYIIHIAHARIVEMAEMTIFALKSRCGYKIERHLLFLQTKRDLVMKIALVLLWYCLSLSNSELYHFLLLFYSYKPKLFRPSLEHFSSPSPRLCICLRLQRACQRMVAKGQLAQADTSAATALVTNSLNCPDPFRLLLCCCLLGGSQDQEGVHLRPWGLEKCVGWPDRDDEARCSFYLRRSFMGQHSTITTSLLLSILRIFAVPVSQPLFLRLF